MRSITIGISDVKVSADIDSELVTYALGSCIGITAWDPARKVGGMLHYLLPAALLARDKSQIRPAMFADLGIPLLLNQMAGFGCTAPNLIITVTGGASINSDQNIFDVGRRNYAAFRRLASTYHLKVVAEDVGGAKSRTVKLSVGEGSVVLRILGQERVLWSYGSDNRRKQL